MLFHFELGPEKDNTEIEEIDRKHNRRMLFNFIPCRFHARAPVNVVENQNRRAGSFLQQCVEVCKGGFVPVIGIDECKINMRNS